MDDLRTLAEWVHFPLMGAACTMAFYPMFHRQLAGFSRGQTHGITAFLSWLVALETLVRASGYTHMYRGVNIALAALWTVTGMVNYHLWKRDDDGKPPRKRIRAWIKARLPQARQTVPVKG